MKFFGHPLHIMLIHFPTALLPMDLLCYFLYYHTGKGSYAEASFYAIFGGVALGWLAIISGAADLVKIPQGKPLVLKSALIHGSINSTVIIIYTVLLYSAYKNYPDLPGATVGLIIIKATLVSFMLLGNYIGGNLILKYKMGVEKSYDNAIE